jgi:hypothetical protein
VIDVSRGWTGSLLVHPADCTLEMRTGVICRPGPAAGGQLIVTDMGGPVSDVITVTRPGWNGNIARDSGAKWCLQTCTVDKPASVAAPSGRAGRQLRHLAAVTDAGQDNLSQFNRW